MNIIKNLSILKILRIVIVIQISKIIIDLLTKI